MREETLSFINNVLIVRIKMFILQNKICPFLNQGACSCSYLAIHFTKLILLIYLFYVFELSFLVQVPLICILLLLFLPDRRQTILFFKVSKVSPR